MLGPTRSALAGFAYFALVFLAGSGLGTVRVLLVAPRIGAVPAILTELPLMLGACWLICGWVVSRLAVPAHALSRLAMGGIAFALLIGAELALTMLTTGESVGDFFFAYRSPSALLGLAGQLIFAAFPLVRAQPRVRREPSPSAAPARLDIDRARRASAQSLPRAGTRPRYPAAASSD